LERKTNEGLGVHRKLKIFANLNLSLRCTFNQHHSHWLQCCTLYQPPKSVLGTNIEEMRSDFPQFPSNIKLKRLIWDYRTVSFSWSCQRSLNLSRRWSRSGSPGAYSTWNQCRCQAKFLSSAKLWPIIFWKLFCFSEQMNKVWRHDKVTYNVELVAVIGERTKSNA